MRIISGKYGGRRLVSFKASHLRPTSDRVKESVFNILRDRVEGSRVLDLFAGTGNLSLEALSRGALTVTSVEQNPRSLDIIRENMKLLGVGHEMAVVRSDVIQYLRKYSGEPFDLILIDPPFTKKMADEVLETLASSAALGPQTLVFIEWSAHETVKAQYGEMHQIDTRDFGDKMISFFTKAQS